MNWDIFLLKQHKLKYHNSDHNHYTDKNDSLENLLLDSLEKNQFWSFTLYPQKAKTIYGRNNGYYQES